MIEQPGTEPLKAAITNLLEEIINEYTKAQSDVIRTSDQLFGYQKKRIFQILVILKEIPVGIISLKKVRKAMFSFKAKFLS